MQLGPWSGAYIGGVPSAEAAVGYQQAWIPPEQQAQPAQERAPSPRTQGQGRVWGAQGRRGNAAAQEELRAMGAAGAAGAGGGLLRDPLLVELAAGDGDAAGLSLVDLKIGHQEIGRILPLLRARAPSEAAFQALIWQLYEVTVLPDGNRRQRVLDLATGSVSEEAAPEGAMLIWTSNYVRSELTGKEHVADNKLDGVDVIGESQREDFAASVEKALEARARLRKDFEFDTSDRSFAAVERMKLRLKPEDIAPFLDDYLTAFFVQGAPPGAGLKFNYDKLRERPVETFFGDPPGCDQLPDGRGIIDCKGFTAVSHVILGALRGPVNQEGGAELALPFCVGPHQLNLLVTGADQVIAIDNDLAEALPMSADEVAYLRGLHEGRFVDEWDLRPWKKVRRSLSGPIDLAQLPTLARFVDDVHDRFGWEERRKVGWLDSVELP